MSTDRIIAGIGCFLMACLLCCCDDTIPMHPEPDMAMACVSCSQTAPYFNCIPSLCAEVNPGQYCCVN